MDQTAAIDALGALAHPTRLAAFRLLVGRAPGSIPALEIADRLDVKASTLSGHLAVLRRAGLVHSTRQQREIRYSVDLARITALVGFLLADCCGGRISHCEDILTLLSETVPSG